VNDAYFGCEAVLSAHVLVRFSSSGGGGGSSSSSGGGGSSSSSSSSSSGGGGGSGGAGQWCDLPSAASALSTFTVVHGSPVRAHAHERSAARLQEQLRDIQREPAEVVMDFVSVDARLSVITTVNKCVATRMC
jgi:hypothetical protein